MYNPNRKCSCGDNLIDCENWSKIKKKTKHINSRFRLSNNVKKNKIDEKGFSLKKLFIVLGISPKILYGNRSITEYIEKNEFIFKIFKDCNKNISYILDASKKPERLDILLRSNNLEIYSVYLRRNLKSQLISHLKRKRIKILGFKFIVEILLLYLRENHRKRIFKKIDSERKVIIDFEDFINNPNAEANKIFKMLKLKIAEKADNMIDISKQHIYTGNRWIQNSDKNVKISKKKSKNKLKLSFMQNLIFEILFKDDSNKLKC